MIRFYKTIAKILRTLKSYLTGAVLKIVLFSYNGLIRYVTSAKGGHFKRRGSCRTVRIRLEEFPTYAFHELGTTPHSL